MIYNVELTWREIPALHFGPWQFHRRFLLRPYLYLQKLKLSNKSVMVNCVCFVSFPLFLHQLSSPAHIVSASYCVQWTLVPALQSTAVQWRPLSLLLLYYNLANKTLLIVVKFCKLYLPKGGTKIDPKTMLLHFVDNKRRTKRMSVILDSCQYCNWPFHRSSHLQLPIGNCSSPECICGRWSNLLSVMMALTPAIKIFRRKL